MCNLRGEIGNDTMTYRINKAGQRGRKSRLEIKPFFWGLIAGALSLVIGVLILGFASDWQLPTTMGIEWDNVLFVVFSSIGIWLAVWRSVSVDRQMEITEYGLHQTRYQSAMNMLGSDSMVARMNAIDILAKIAEEDSEKYIPIMELLAAFVRHPTINPKLEIRYPRDAHKALNAILNRSKWQKKSEPEGWHIDFTGAHLINADMRDADLDRIKLDGARLSNSNLSNVTGLTKSQLEKTCYHYIEDDAGNKKCYPPKLTGVEFPNIDKELTYEIMDRKIHKRKLESTPPTAHLR
ncbi:MAG: pentapeptide repeat-containing protein [Proteobacteria bacterium]|nr:pentapeptide repeat-containing protein [Pseudomonadota bacterium]